MSECSNRLKNPLIFYVYHLQLLTNDYYRIKIDRDSFGIVEVEVRLAEE